MLARRRCNGCNSVFEAKPVPEEARSEGREGRGAARHGARLIHAFGFRVPLYLLSRRWRRFDCAGSWRYGKHPEREERCVRQPVTRPVFPVAVAGFLACHSQQRRGAEAGLGSLGLDAAAGTGTGVLVPRPSLACPLTRLQGMI
jgi:hypothetical protein